MIMSPAIDVSIARSTTSSLTNAQLEVFLAQSPLAQTKEFPYETIAYDTYTALQFAENSQCVPTEEPTDTADPELVDKVHTPTLKPVFVAASAQPLSCCYAIQTRRKTRAAAKECAAHTVTSLSVLAHGLDVFTEKFVMILEPFQLILEIGDITGMTVPAILSPNNEYLDEAKGVAQRIINAGGPKIALKCQGQKKVYTVLTSLCIRGTEGW